MPLRFETSPNQAKLSFENYMSLICMKMNLQAENGFAQNGLLFRKKASFDKEEKDI